MEIVQDSLVPQYLSLIQHSNTVVFSLLVLSWDSLVLPVPGSLVELLYVVDEVVQLVPGVARDDGHGILEKVSDDGDDIFKKVSDDAKDIIENVSNDGDDLFEKVYDDAKDILAGRHFFLGFLRTAVWSTRFPVRFSGKLAFCTFEFYPNHI